MEKQTRVNKKAVANVIIFIISVVAWCGIVYFSFDYSKDFIGQSVDKAVQANNKSLGNLSDEIEELNAKVDGLNIEIRELNLDNEALTEENQIMAGRLKDLNEDINQITINLQDVVTQIKLSSDNQATFCQVLIDLQNELGKLSESVDDLGVMPLE